MTAKRGADHLGETGIDVWRLFEVGAGSEVDDELPGADLDPLAIGRGEVPVQADVLVVLVLIA